MRIVRFTDAYLADDVMMEHIASVEVRIFGVAKTIADCFCHRRKVGQSVALEGLREALRQVVPRKIQPQSYPGGLLPAQSLGGISAEVRLAHA